MSSLSNAAVHPDAGDALIAKPPRPAPLHAARNYATLQQNASPIVPTPPSQQQQHATPGPGGASPYTDYLAPPVGSISVADAASGHGHGHGLHVSVPVGFDAHLQSGERSVGGRSMAPQSSLMLEDDDAETFLTEERNCCCGLCGCRSCACGRCLSHTWFLLACCGFVFLSSLPRILTIVDFIVTALIYSLSFAGRSSPSLSFWDFMKDDFENYSFRTSGGSLVILSLVRMLVLFWTFAYRFHLHRGAFIVATIVACISTGFVVLKFALNQNSHLLSLLVWSLGITLAEWFVWMSLRRQRIKNPDLKIDHHHHIEAAQTAALIAEDDVGVGASTAEASLLEQGIHRHSPSLHPEESPAMLPRTMAADIRPSPSTAASASHKQVSSYQRLEGDEQMALPPSMVANSPRITRGGTAGSAASSFSSASLSSSSSLGSSLMMFPRLGAPAEREVDPRSLADPDSLFIELDSLVVHYKLSINGRAIVGRDAERQARAWGAAAREGRDILSNLAHSHSHSQSRASEDDAHDRTPSATEEEPLRGSKSAGSSFSPAAAAGSASSFGAPIASAIPASSASVADRPHTFRHPIVLLHGFGSSLFAFRALWPDLSQQCSILLAFDRPGFGLTSRPLKDASGSYGSWVERDELNPSARGVLREQPNPYTTEYSASLLMKLLSKLGLAQERCVFVGHSTGGSLALRTAIVAPERTLGCFLISPHILTAGFPDLVKSLLATKLGKLITQQLVRSEMGEVALKRAWYDASHIPPEALSNYQRVLGVKHQMEALVEVSSASASEKEQDALANLAEHFAALAVPHAHAQTKGAAAAAASSSSSSADLGAHAPGLLPILLLHGVQDKLLSVSESSKVYRALKSAGANVTLIKINHCGHVPHEEYPNLTLEHLYGFLHEIEEGGGSGGRTATMHEEEEEH